MSTPAGYPVALPVKMLRWLTTTHQCHSQHRQNGHLEAKCELELGLGAGW